MATNNEPRKLKSIERMWKIVDTIQEFDGARVGEIAAELEMAESTVHSHLSTLKQFRYLHQEGDHYYIGLKFLNIGGYARRRRKVYSDIFPKVTKLANETGERAQFIVNEHDIGIYLHLDLGEDAVQLNDMIGKEVFLHSTAAGKAILADMEQEHLERVISRWGLPPITENTITDEPTLAKELQKVRKNGFAKNFQESEVGISAYGVAIRGRDEILGGLSVTGPSKRLETERAKEEIPELLLGISNELELKANFS